MVRSDDRSGMSRRARSHRRSGRVGPAAIFVLLALLAGACSGDDDEASPAPDPAAAPSSAADTAAVDSLPAPAEDAAFRVTYESRENGDPTADPFTISQDGTGNLAFLQGDEQLIEQAGGDVLQCSGLAPGGTPDCVRLPDGVGLDTLAAGFLAPAVAIREALVQGNAPLTSAEQAQVAGRTAQCISFDAPDSVETGGAVTFCVDVEVGVMLRYLAAVGTDSTELIATEFAAPEDGDFQPPVPARDAAPTDGLPSGSASDPTTTPSPLPTPSS